MKSDTNAPDDGRKWFHSLTSIKSMVVLLLLLGLLLFWLRGRQETLSDTEAVMRESSARAVADAESEARRSARMKSGGRALPEGVITTHEPEQLKVFYLIECKGHRVSLHTALKLLDEAYQDACYFSLEKPLKLHYTVEEKSDKLISFSIKGKTWSDALNYIAALAGMEVKQEGLEVRLTPLVLESKVASFFYTESMREKMLQQLIDRGDWDEQAEKPDIATILRLHGLVENAEITYIISSSMLVIKGTNLETAALAALVRMEEEIPRELSIKSKIFSSPTALELPQGALTEEAISIWIRELVTKDGIQLITAPSAIARSGKSVTIEVIEERGSDWTGMKFNYLTQLIGLKLSAESTTEIRPVDQALNNQRSEDQFAMYEGDTQIKAIGHDAGGYYYQMTSLKNVQTIEREEFTRQTVDQILNNPNRTAEPPVAKAIPGKAGYVFSPYTNKVVDIRDIPQGTLVADPNFPPEEKKFFRVP